MAPRVLFRLGKSRKKRDNVADGSRTGQPHIWKRDSTTTGQGIIYPGSQDGQPLTRQKRSMQDSVRIIIQ